MITKTLKLFSTTAADDLSYLSLFDACRLSAEKNVRIIGGHMVQLLSDAFPTDFAFPRRTVDADAAIETELAASGQMHQLFEAAGYQASSGNSYQKSGRSVDLLVSSMDGRFSTQILGDRAFDSSPGISSALNTDPIAIQVEAALTTSEIIEFEARVPSVEVAVLLKALVYKVRLANRDLLDLQNLLWIAKLHPSHEIGGWNLDQPRKGVRGDAQRALWQIQGSLKGLNSNFSKGIDPSQLSALISDLIATP